MTTNNSVNSPLSGTTGTGNFVGATSPTLVTPTIGAATATSVTFSPTTSGIVGTTTNDNAAAGKVGEFVTSYIASGSAVTSTSNTAVNVTSISLTAGDWDVNGTVCWLTFGTAPTTVVGWTSTTSATQPADPGLTAGPRGATWLSAGTSFTVPYARYSLSTTTTVYLSGQLSNTSGNGTVCGSIFARRVR